jgi:hypothetical protein
MSIFQYYPKVAYKVDNVDYIKAIDITTSIKIKDFFKTYRGISFTPYVVKDGERPGSKLNKFDFELEGKNYSLRTAIPLV